MSQILAISNSCRSCAAERQRRTCTTPQQRAGEPDGAGLSLESNGSRVDPHSGRVPEVGDVVVVLVERDPFVDVTTAGAGREPEPGPAVGELLVHPVTMPPASGRAQRAMTMRRAFPERGRSPLERWGCGHPLRCRVPSATLTGSPEVPSSTLMTRIPPSGW